MTNAINAAPINYSADSKIPGQLPYLITSQFLFVITGYLIYVGLARMLSEESFGVYGVVIGVFTVINMVINLGIQQTVSKFVSEDTEHSYLIMKRLFKMIFIFSLVIMVLLFLTAPIIAYLLNDPSLTSLIQWSGLIIFFYALFTVYIGYFNGEKAFRKQGLYTILYIFLKTAGILSFVYFGFEVFGAIIGFIVATVLSFIIAFVAIHKINESKELKERYQYVKHKLPLKKIADFALPLMGYAVVMYLVMYLDIFFVKALSPVSIANSNAGYYTAAQSLSRIPTFITNTFIIVVFPLIAASVSQNNASKSREYIRRSTRYTVAAVLPIAIAIMTTAEPLLTLFYSSKYVVAAGSLQILMFGLTFFALFTLLANIAAGSGKPKIALYISLSILVLISALSYFLVPLYGITGAAASASISFFLGMLIMSIYIYKEFKALIQLKSLLKILSAGIVMFIIGSVFNVVYSSYQTIFSSLFYLILYLGFVYLILGLVYAGMLYFCKEIKKEDINLYNRIVRKRFLQLNEKMFN